MVGRVDESSLQPEPDPRDRRHLLEEGAHQTHPHDGQNEQNTGQKVSPNQNV